MSFEDSVRKLFEAPEDANVRVEIKGGGSVQIGDMTWEDEPTEIEVAVSWGTGRERHYKTRHYDTIPDLWEALGGMT